MQNFSPTNEYKGVDPMKSYRKELTFTTPRRVEIVPITDQVNEALRESGIQEGLCLVNAMHITSSVFINDNEKGLWQDYINWLERLAPMNQSGNTCTTGRVKPMGMPISNGRSWAGKWLLRLPAANWILARGSRSSTANSTGNGPRRY